VKTIESQMNDRGYVRVYGMAQLNDVIATRASQAVLSTKLTDNKALNEFNYGDFNEWEIYREDAK